MGKLKIDRDRVYEFSSKVYRNDDDILCYQFECDINGACLGELGLLLASLHMIENHIIERIDDIEPLMESEK